MTTQEKLLEVFETLKEIYNKNMDMKIGELTVTMLVLLLSGVIFGWMILGWVVFPVQWEYPEIPEPYKMNDISYDSKAVYVRLLSEWNAFMPNSSYLPLYIDQINDIDIVACDMADNTDDLGETQRYIKIAYEKNGVGCE